MQDRTKKVSYRLPLRVSTTVGSSYLRVGGVFLFRALRREIGGGSGGQMHDYEHIVFFGHPTYMYSPCLVCCKTVDAREDGGYGTRVRGHAEGNAGSNAREN